MILYKLFSSGWSGEREKREGGGGGRLQCDMRSLIYLSIDAATTLNLLSNTGRGANEGNFLIMFSKKGA